MVKSRISEVQQVPASSKEKSSGRKYTSRPNPYHLFFCAALFLCVAVWCACFYAFSLSWWVSIAIAINATAFILCGYDKNVSSGPEGPLRVPELVLWMLALFGGSPALLLGMKFFRHKTKKVQFHFVLAIILIVQVVGVVRITQAIREAESSEQVRYR